MTTRSVLIVLFEGVQSLDATGPLEVFAGAGSVATAPAELVAALRASGLVVGTA